VEDEAVADSGPSVSLLSEEDDDDIGLPLPSLSSLLSSASSAEELPVALVEPDLVPFGFRKKSNTIMDGGRLGRRTMSTTSKTGWSFSTGEASVPLGSSMSSVIVVVSS